MYLYLDISDSNMFKKHLSDVEHKKCHIAQSFTKNAYSKIFLCPLEKAQQQDLRGHANWSYGNSVRSDMWKKYTLLQKKCTLISSIVKEPNSKKCITKGDNLCVMGHYETMYYQFSGSLSDRNALKKIGWFSCARHSEKSVGSLYTCCNVLAMRVMNQMTRAVIMIIQLHVCL